MITSVCKSDTCKQATGGPGTWEAEFWRTQGWGASASLGDVGMLPGRRKVQTDPYEKSQAQAGWVRRKQWTEDMQ